MASLLTHNAQGSILGMFLTNSLKLEQSASSPERHMLMAVLTFMSLQIGEDANASDAMTLPMSTLSTLILCRHGELHILAGIMQRRMATLWQEGSNAQEDPAIIFCERIISGTKLWMQSLENSFLNLLESWHLLISPSLSQVSASMLTGGMQSLLQHTRDRLSEIFDSTCHHILDLSSGATTFVQGAMDNLVRISFLRGGSSLHSVSGASAGGLVPHPPVVSLIDWSKRSFAD
ncbi:MAG: hypothetical protein [Gemycircularvirus minti6]|uniref:Uncharacterized protein n=1 Tax=Genomoviridae sp. TaxID=2202565 RepID=A0A345N0J7_9VIRU|nr:MAG: hypothetical protein QKB73_gp2 [Genomoviridae sp.]AXH77147.1 MAG: hypothetical protein [Genomoviridae sp.]